MAAPLRWMLRRRTTWFALGALAGILAALGLMWRVPATATAANRTLVVGPPGQGTFGRIADAMLAARPGDTVRVEPGVYPEQVLVPDGVSLVARVPSSVTLVRAADSTAEWVAITAAGSRGGRIAGIRIASTADRQIDTGVRVAGQQRTIEMIEIEGPLRAGVELLAGAGLTLHGSHFAVQGAAIAAGDRSHATLTRNVFLRDGRQNIAPLHVTSSAQTRLEGNLFAGFGPEIVRGGSVESRQQIAAANVIVTSEPSRPR